MKKEYAEIVDLGIKNFRVVRVNAIKVPSSWHSHDKMNTVKVESESLGRNFRIDTWVRNFKKDCLQRHGLQYLPSSQKLQHLF